MRNRLLYAQIASFIRLLVTVVTSCHHSSKDAADRGVVIDSICKDTVLLMKKGQQNPNLHITLNLKFLTGPHSREINDTILRQVLSPDYLSLSSDSISPVQMVDSFLVSYYRDYCSFYGQVWSEEPQSTNANISLNIQSEVHEGRDGILVYLAHISRKQGVEQMDYTKAYNIDLDNGIRLHLDDVFVPGFERDLNEQITRQLCKQFNVDDEAKMADAGLFVHTDVYATHNFILDNDSIHFIYISGEIASSDIGEITVTIPYSDISNILR